MAETNVAPTVDLNGPDAGTSTAIVYQESDPQTPIAPAATLDDPDSPEFVGGMLTVRIVDGAGPFDQLVVVGGGFQADENSLYYAGRRIGSITGGVGGFALRVMFDQEEVTDEYGTRATREIVEALLRSIGFFNVSDEPVAGTRTIEFILTDGAGGTSQPATAEVAVQAVDDPAIAQDDQFVAPENSVLAGNLFIDNGFGPDQDPDGTISVITVNGEEAVGQTITLDSGARLTVQANGNFRYDPRGAFELVPANATMDTPSGPVDVPSGAANPTSATDSFTYAIDGGDEATVTITVAGEAEPDEVYYGTDGDDFVVGTDFRDFFRMEQGGNDQVIGKKGRDVFYFGAEFTPGDRVVGGGDGDILILQGAYHGLVFGNGSASNISGIGSISLFSGSNESYGDTEGNFYGYDLTFLDSNVAAGATLKVNGYGLLPGESMYIDGSAESDGSFLIYAGGCDDTLIGGAGNDIFFFGHDGRFGGGDYVDGNGGYDVVYLRGNYAIDFNGFFIPDVTFGAFQFVEQQGPEFIYAAPDALTDIESVGLLSASDTTYAGGGGDAFHYWIITADETVGEGRTMTFNASRLTADETFVFDGSAETDGQFRLFGGAGADSIAGGEGDDLLYGGLSADYLVGNGGADVFRYQAAAESTPEAPDTIDGFETGVDKVDLGRIDVDPAAPGDQAFTFIGDAAFSGRAGELRLVFDDANNRWEAQGDLDGDAEADFLILFTGAETVAGSDFML